PANWSTNTVPTTGDDASIILAGSYTVTLASTTLALNSLTLGNASSTQTFTVDNSALTLAAASAVTTKAIFSINNSTLDGAGTLNLGTTRTINKPAAAHTNSGSILVTGGNLTIALSGASPSFTSTGSIAVQTARTLTVIGGPLTLADSTLTSSGTVAANINN